jgi:hypothetical protein
VANLHQFLPVEDVFTGIAYIETHASKYTKSDLYSIILPKVFTWPSKNYYYVKGRFKKAFQEFALTLPTDPVTTSPAWQTGDSLKYGVYGSVGIYPGLDLSVDQTSNTYRNAVFQSVKTRMMADPNLA